MIAVAENQVVSDSTIAIDSNARTLQRDASAPGCNEPDTPVDSIAGIVAPGSPQGHRVDGGRAREAYFTSLIAHGRFDLADRLVRPHLLDLNPAGDFLVNADRFDEFPFHREKNRSRARQVFRYQGIQDAGSDTALHDQFAKN